ncbi:hypothetical protein [Campylobacter magnus]|uniref:hypothetical protein n=1 Tax=Campylobacter magnus TaxID=3026462 RepID=UPI0026E0C2E9|nr:hypothetical protein [Campylobacter magnus]MDO2408456.1 hypothetical protein [Campylobacter magnus]
MQERAKGAQHIYQSQNRTKTALETQNEPNPSPSIPQSSKRSQIALKCVFFVKIRKKTAKGKNARKNQRTSCKSRVCQSTFSTRRR